MTVASRMSHRETWLGAHGRRMHPRLPTSAKWTMVRPTHPNRPRAVAVPAHPVPSSQSAGSLYEWSVLLQQSCAVTALYRRAPCPTSPAAHFAAPQPLACLLVTALPVLQCCRASCRCSRWRLGTCAAPQAPASTSTRSTQPGVRPLQRAAAAAGAPTAAAGAAATAGAFRARCFARGGGLCGWPR
jgi:hypothetical protein